jgi:hypothetical protein
VNSFTRGLCLGLLSLAMLGVTGCSADNETEVEKLSKGMGDPGEGTTKVDPSKTQTVQGGYPTSEKEFFDRQGNVDLKKATKSK